MLCVHTLAGLPDMGRLTWRDTTQTQQQQDRCQQKERLRHCDHEGGQRLRQLQPQAQRGMGGPTQRPRSLQARLVVVHGVVWWRATVRLMGCYALPCDGVCGVVVRRHVIWWGCTPVLGVKRELSMHVDSGWCLLLWGREAVLLVPTIRYKGWLCWLQHWCAKTIIKCTKFINLMLMALYHIIVALCCHEFSRNTSSSLAITFMAPSIVAMN